MKPIPWKRTVTLDGEESVEETYLAAHAGEHTLPEWASLLGRTTDGVAKKLQRMGVAAKLDIPAQDPAAKCYQGVPVKAILALLKEGPRSCAELSSALDRGMETVRSAIAAMQGDGYTITEEAGLVSDAPPGRTPPPPTLADRPAKVFRLGIVSDTHGGDRAAQYSNLHAYTHIAREEYGVTHVLHAGDVTAGMGVYDGQVYDLYAHGVQEQVEDTVHNLPEGVEWWLLGGNHDWSHWRRDHVDVVQLIAKEREDIHYLGSQSADVPITEAIDGRLWHPRGGVPYSISYRGQRYAAEVAFAELARLISQAGALSSAEGEDGEEGVSALVSPNSRIRLIAIGHLHVMALFMRGPLLILQAGCFQGQTAYLKEHGLYPAIGGWVLECTLTDTGLLQQIAPHWIGFTEITDDYKAHFQPKAAKHVELHFDPLYRLF